MSGRRAAVAVVLLFVSGLLLLAGGPLLYLKREVVDSGRFADRLVTALREDAVRDALARRVTTAIVAAHPDLIALRPVIAAAARKAAGSGAFAAVVRASALELHESVFDRDRATVALTLPDAGVLVVDALGPGLAKRIPAEVRSRVASVVTLRETATDAADRLKQLAGAAVALLAGAALAMIGALLLISDRKRRLRGAGVTVAIAGGIGALLLVLARSEVLDRVAGSSDRAASGVVWDAYLGGLLGWCLATLAGGVILTVAAVFVPSEAVRGDAEPSRPRGRRAAIALVTAGLIAVAVLGLRSATTPEAFRVGGNACNGSRALCGKRLDQVVFASTHNSMAAADEPGWFFAQQETGIANQLSDGIRGLLIDTHYGVRTPRGVATDLEAEGTTRAKLVAEIGEVAVRAAEKVRATIGFTGNTKPGVYLCHGACEVGATPIVPALEQIRDFAVRHPREVIVVSIQDEVSPADTADAFRRSGLLPLVYDGPSGPPWPTLGELVDSGRRVVVFGENHTGDLPWYRPQFELMQDTPFGFRSVAALRAPSSCDPNRGPRDAALFLLNHWVDTPPANRPSNARVANARDFLLSRARACERVRDRLPNLLAVDFYREGDVVGAADALNGLGSK